MGKHKKKDRRLRRLKDSAEKGMDSRLRGNDNRDREKGTLENGRSGQEVLTAPVGQRGKQVEQGMVRSREVARAARASAIYQLRTQEHEAQRGKYPANYGSSGILDAFAEHPVLYRAAFKAASTLANIPIQVCRRETYPDGTEELVNLPDHPYRQLLDNPSPIMTYMDMVRQNLLFALLKGRCYLAMENASREFVTLHPDCVRPKLSKTKGLAGWFFAVNGKEEELKIEEVWFLHLPDPRQGQEWGGIGPAEAAAKMLTLDFYAVKHNTLYFEQGGEPGPIFTSEQTLPDDIYERTLADLEERYAGIDRHHAVTLMSGGLKPEFPSGKPTDWSFDELHKTTMHDVMMSIGMPSGVGGNVEGVTYSNFEVQIKTFYEDMMTMFLAPFAAQGTLFARRRRFLQPNEELRFDNSGQKIEMLDMGKLALAASRAKDQQTVNEIRQGFYRKPPIVGGDVIITNNGLVIDEKGVIRHVDSYKPQSGPQINADENNGANGSEGNEEGRIGRVVGSLNRMVRVNEKEEEILGRRAARMEELVNLHAGRLTNIAVDVFRKLWESEIRSQKSVDRNQELWIERLTPGGGNGRGFVAALAKPSDAGGGPATAALRTPLIRGQKGKELTVDEVFDAGQVAEEWIRELDPVLRRIGREWGVGELAKVLEGKEKAEPQLTQIRGLRRLHFLNRAEGEFNWGDFLESVAQEFFKKIKAISESLKNDIASVIVSGLKEEKGGREIAKDLASIDGFEALAGVDDPPRGGLDNPGSKLQRALRIAETEVVGITEAATQEAWRQSGVVSGKEWNCIFNNSRDAHIAMHGQRVGLDEVFTSGAGNELRYPGDPSAPAEEVVFCQCYQTSVLVGEEV